MEQTPPTNLEMFEESNFSKVKDMNEGWVNPIPLHDHDLEPLKQRVLREVQPILDHASNQAADKNSVRKAHFDQRKNLLNSSADFIFNYEDELLPYFASGDEIDPAKIQAEVVPVRTAHDANLFRYASFQWSVPVSQGYGRRNKFLVKDHQNGKLIGIFALGDPVINLGARDSAVGWNAEHRKRRLYNVLDSYVLGAVEPYRQLIGGKLIAMTAVSNEVQRFITNKYSGSKTDLINGKSKISAPALFTTTSALGKSSVYNRLKFHDNPILYPVGYSSGFGHFQFSESLFDDLVDLVRSQNATGIGNKFGQGANWRFRVIKQALTSLGLNQNLLQHGVAREVFLAPLANNFREFLRSETDELELIDYPLGELNEFFTARWAIPRAKRMPEFIDWKFDQWRASSDLDVGKQFIQSSIFTNASRETIMSSQNPAVIDLGEYKIAVGTEYKIIEGITINGEFTKGKAYCSTLRGPDVDLQITDIEWSNGERDIQAQSLGTSAELLADVVKRQRIGIYKSPAHTHLCVMDLRTSLRLGSGRSTAKKLSIEELSTLIGLKIDKLIHSLPNAALSTREKLLRDTGLRRTDLAAVFPSYDRSTPVLVWCIVRPLSLLAESGKLKPLIGSIQVEGRAPELDLRESEL